MMENAVTLSKLTLLNSLLNYEKFHTPNTAVVYSSEQTDCLLDPLPQFTRLLTQPTALISVINASVLSFTSFVRAPSLSAKTHKGGWPKAEIKRCCSLFWLMMFSQLSPFLLLRYIFRPSENISTGK